MSNKKLSLEQRLSLAAKKGKKKSKASKNTLLSNGTKSQQQKFDLTKETDENRTRQFTNYELDKDKEQRSNVAQENTKVNKDIDREQTVISNNNDTNNNSNGESLRDAISESIQKGPVDPNSSTKIENEKVESLPLKEFSLFKEWLPDNYTSLSVVNLLAILKPHIETLQKNNSSNVNKPYNNDSSLLKLVKEKDQIIDNLKKKADKLDKDNQNFNKNIKSNEIKINNLENKNEALQNDLKDKIQSIKHLQDDLKENNVKLKQLLENNETVSDLKNELKERNNTIESLKLHLNNMENKVNTLTDNLLKERETYFREKNTIKEAARDQVTTLESKLEQLRIELENNTHSDKDIVTFTGSNNGQTNDNNQDTAANRDDAKTNNHHDANSTNSSLIPWKTQYYRLQEQFNSSKANWNSVEFTLNSKLSDLQEEIDSSNMEINELKSKCENNDILIQRLKNAVDEKDKLINENSIKINDLLIEKNKLVNSLQEINDDYNLLQKKFEIQRKQLTNNITHNMDHSTFQENHESISPLNETRVVKENNSDFENQSNCDVLLKFENDWSLPLPPVSLHGNSSMERDLNVNGNSEEMYDDMNISFKQRSNSVKNNDNIPETSFNLESYLLNKTSSSLSISNYEHKTSTTQLLANPPLLSEISGNFISPTDNINNAENINNDRRNSYVNINDNTIVNSNNNHINTQLVSRLGSEVRRLEGELTSLQISYEQLKNEKNSANEELLKLIEENEKVKAFKNERDSLESRVTELENQLEAALQLLGEKTEYAEELENDVQDLKEMMKQQIQQMIQMQEKSR